MGDIYTQLPLSMDPATKAISAPASSPAELTNFLTELNTMHRTLKTAPPASHRLPSPGNQAFRHQRYEEAVNMYSHAITMALTRPVWEPAPLLKEELQVLYANRAQAHMSCNNYPEALADASLSVDFKRGQNSKAHWRKAKCLKEMGRLEEAKETLEFALEFGDDGDMKSLLKEVEKLLK
ncbi:hypothetical protein BDD12DRAFT_852440 [Trichophaea hybrida]|nr:hypothetical protein BDD12DRAFT_852440 [Trichophaea hybrida]